MTLKQLKSRVQAQPKTHGLAGYYNTGELYINDKDGKTVVGPFQMDREFAKQFCKEHKLSFTEV